MKEDSLDLDDEDMDMLARMFKRFFKKAKAETPQQDQEHRARTVLRVCQVWQDGPHR